MGCETGPMREELMNNPAPAMKMHGDVVAWAEKLAQRIVHEHGRLPQRVNYDKACKGHCTSLGFRADGQRLADTFHQILKPDVVESAFVFAAEDPIGQKVCTVQMVAMRQLKDPTEYVFLELEPDGISTSADDIRDCQNFPWFLKLCMRPDISRKVSLAFDIDAMVFGRLTNGMDVPIEVSASWLEYTPVNFCTLRVTAIKDPTTLQSELLDEMIEMKETTAAAAGPVDDEDDVLSEMRDLHEPGAGAAPRPKPKPKGPKDEGPPAGGDDDGHGEC
eukprot:9475371-Pyramimonas_sp.AAC.1